MIEIKDLSVTYDEHIQALKHISLVMEEQGCIGIVGENGSGKSTLLLAIMGLVDYQGHLLTDGLEVKDNIEKIREKIGFVFQNSDHQLFMTNVYQDIAFGLINQGKTKDNIDKEIEYIAKLLNIEDLLSRSSSHLSGGQKRMIALATVLVMKPDILLLDEPTAFLDPKSRRKVINVLKQLDQQIIFATHDLDMALDICDEVILLNQGQIKAIGKAQDILTNQKLLEDNGLELPFRLQ